MEPLRIVARVVFAYLVLLLFIRTSGKRSLRHGTPLDLTIALVVGDIVDNLLWAEVPAAQFVVASGSLLAAHSGANIVRFHLGRSARGSA